jgi:hypothetical protein
VNNGIYRNKECGQEDIRKTMVRDRYENGHSVFITGQEENKVDGMNLISMLKIVKEWRDLFYTSAPHVRKEQVTKGD